MTLSAAGPLKGVAPIYTPFTHLSNMTLDKPDDDGVITVENHTLGSYTIPAGAIDTFLTTYDSKPVVTLVPITGIAPFASGSIHMSPVAALVLANYTQQQGDGFAPAVPGPSHWKQAYEAILGGSLPDGDYLAGNSTPGSSAHLSISAMDAMLHTLPSLGGYFAIRMFNHSDPADLVSQFYSSMVGMNVSNLINPGTIYTLMSENIYMHGGDMPQHTRKLMQTSSGTLSQILLDISATLATSNSLAANILAQAQTSLASGSTPSVDLFYQLAQIASVQSTSLAAAIDNIVTQITSGDLTGALAAAMQVQATYTGASLKAMVDSATVNTAAIDSTTGNTHSSHALAIGLGVGLGVGIPVVALAVLGAVMYVKKRRAMQATAPAAPAEPTHV